MRRQTCSALALVLVQAAVVPASANQESDALRARAALETYNMDRERALATYRQAVAADPEDPAAYRGLASALWLGITFRRGNMTVDEYLGRVNRTKQAPAPPPAEDAAAFQEALAKAVALARKRLEANPRDLDAHYQLGAAA